MEAKMYMPCGISLLLISLFAGTTSAFWCPAGWASNGTSCYFIEHNKTVTWSVALQKCKDITGHLATIEETVENTYLKETGPDTTGLDYWIGLKKTPNSNTWSWSDGSSSTWNNWDPGEPDGDGDCTRLTNVHNGKWRDRSCTDFQNPYICERLKECGYVGSVVQAGSPSLNKSRNLVGTTVNYTCNIGWIFPDNQVTNIITCELGGEWSVISNCQIVVCDPPITLNNTNANSTDKSYLSVVGYECDPGYWFSREELNKTRSMQCQHDAHWSLNITACIPITCPSPISPFATWNNNFTGIGAVVNYTCIEGYEYPNNESVTTFTCQNDGEWSPNATTSQCQIKHCPWPNIPNSKRDTDNHEYGSTVEFTCHIGYRYNDSASKKHTTCKSDKTWDFYIPPCEAVLCPKLENVTHATMNSSEAIYGSAVNFTCEDGYFFPDISTMRIIHCNKHAAWTAKVPACRLASLIPKVPLNVNHGADEADGAVSVGTITICLIVTFFVFMIILDIVTCKPHIDRLKTNLAGCTELCWGEEEDEDVEVEEHRQKILDHDHMDNIDEVGSDTTASRSGSRQLGSLASLKSNKVGPSKESGKEKETIWEKDGEIDGLDDLPEDEKIIIPDDDLKDLGLDDDDDALLNLDDTNLDDLDLDAELAKM